MPGQPTLAPGADDPSDGSVSAPAGATRVVAYVIVSVGLVLFCCVFVTVFFCRKYHPPVTSGRRPVVSLQVRQS